MNYCVSKTTVEENVHANPHIHWSKNALLILLIFASVVKEDAVKKFFTVDLSEWRDLDLFFTVAAESRLLRWVSSLKHWIKNVLTRWQILNFLVRITNVSLRKRCHIFVVLLSFIHHFTSKQEDRSRISRRWNIDPSCILLCDCKSACSALCD